MKSGNNTITDNAGMASMTILGSVFTREDTINVPDVVPLFSASSVDNILFTANDVKEKLKPGSSPDPDNITAKILQDFSNILAPSLAMIYNKLILTGEVPYDWRYANVIPIFKKGSKKLPQNCKPVSLTSIPCKMIESINKDKVMYHFICYQLIKDTQHDLMSNSHAPLICWNFWNL